MAQDDEDAEEEEVGSLSAASFASARAEVFSGVPVATIPVEDPLAAGEAVTMGASSRTLLPADPALPSSASPSHISSSSSPPRAPSSLLAVVACDTVDVLLFLLPGIFSSRRGRTALGLLWLSGRIVVAAAVPPRLETVELGEVEAMTPYPRLMLFVVIIAVSPPEETVEAPEERMAEL